MVPSDNIYIYIIYTLIHHIFANDCEHYPVHEVIEQYEKLIADVRAQCDLNANPATYKI